MCVHFLKGGMTQGGGQILGVGQVTCRVIHTDFDMGGDRSPPIGGDLRGGQGSDGEGLARDLRQEL